MIIVIGSQKGGVGKSTLAINIASWLALKSKDVVLVDADVQATSARWASDRQEVNLPVIHSLQKYGDIKNTLKDLDKRYDFVVVDVAGKDSKELRTGMLAADILIVPFRPSQMDLDTIVHLDGVIDNVKDFNDSLKVYAVLNLSPTNPSITEVDDAKEYLTEYPNFHLLKTIIRERKVYRDTVSLGKGVMDVKHEKANIEINDLMNEVL